MYAGDLLRGGMKFEGEYSNDGEEREEIAKVGDDLGVPEAAHGGKAQHFAHGERSGCAGCFGLCGGAHIDALC